jgi:general secretion pathway protein G
MENSTMTSRRPSRHAFSLLELMLVLTIMALLAGVAAVAIGRRGDEAKKDATKSNLRVIHDALDAYKLRNNVYPENLEALVGDYLQAMPRDGWGQTFFYTPNTGGPANYVLMSFGPDMKENTGDDISIWEVLEGN